MIKQKIIDDVTLALQDFKPSDDFEIDDRLINKRVDTARAALLPPWIKKNIDIPGSALKRFSCKPAKTNTPVCLSGPCWAMWFIDLPTYTDDNNTTISVGVIQLPDDKGVFRISRQGGRMLDRLRTSGEIDILAHSRFSRYGTKKCRDKEAWYRIGTKIYLVGDSFRNSNIECDIIISDTAGLADTDEYPIPIGLEEPIKQLVISQLFEQYYKGAEDLGNDGRQSKIGASAGG